MTEIRKKIEAMMAAIAFAEEGEFETAKALMTTRKRGVLAIRNGALDRKACTYALNTCKRIGIGLDLLVVGDKDEEKLDPSVAPFLERLAAEGVPFAVIQKSGCLKKAILSHTSAEHDILFVVIESQGTLERHCAPKDKRLSEAWRKLHCPLVVVAEGLKA